MKNGFVGAVFLIFLSEGLGRRLESHKPDRYDGIGDLVTFRLYTRQNPIKGTKLPVEDGTELLRSGFNMSLKTVLCTHGFMDTANSSWVLKIKSNLLMEEEVNFITVDYSQPAKNVFYNEVVLFLEKLGKYIGQFLKFLQTKGNLELQNVHLIGHSLGAQAMAFAALSFPSRTIARVTGLDPAAPLFRNRPESKRLNPAVAKVVDVIHTCVHFVGMKKAVGTIDFYPNGGFNQTGCSFSDLRCHHGRSHDYFFTSILTNNRNKYLAAKCKTLENALQESCNGVPATMGYHLNYSSPGIYYLKIN